MGVPARVAAVQVCSRHLEVPPPPPAAPPPAHLRSPPAHPPLPPPSTSSSSSSAMNIFRILGDLSHYAAILTIFAKVLASRSCTGVSGRSQILFLLVFLTRYIDLFTTSIKIFFIVSTMTNIYLVLVKYSGTISSDLDTFRVEFLILGAAVGAILVNHELTAMEVLWTFSIYLESVAILPQLSMSSKVKAVDPAILGYLACLASHKLFYIFNWVHRYYNEVRGVGKRKT